MKIWRRVLRFLYIRIAKPLLFLSSPDRMHSWAIALIELFQSLRLTFLVRVLFGPRRVQSVEVGGLNLPNKVGLSAGFDKNGQSVPVMGALGFGFVTVGSITLNPRRGNARPWFFRLPKTKSLVVHAGLANVGVKEVLRNLKRTRAEGSNAVVVASVALVASDANQGVADIINDAIECADILADSGRVQAIEFNISCPNIQDDKLFSVPANFQMLVDQIDSRGYDMPLLVKMPLLHDVDHFDSLVEIASKSDVGGLTIANLEKDRGIASKVVVDELPDDIKGGLSGSVTKSHNLTTIKRVRVNYGDRFFIVGVGGIFNASDAQEYIDSGADLVGMITGVIFEGPQVVGEIADAIN